MSTAVGRGWAYYVVSITITIVLALAANTSFGGLPILASLLSRDNYLPHLFSLRDERLVFGNGIWALAVMSGTLMVVVRGNTNSLIPLFAIGVFIGFTLAQAGLVQHWRRHRPPGWRRRALVNGFGALVTASATLIFLVSKFLEGAWVVVLAVPAFIYLFHRVEHYYRGLATEMDFGGHPARPSSRRTRVVVPVTRVSLLTACALSEALSMGQEVMAVTVVFDGEAEQGGGHPPDIEAEWASWDPGVELHVLHTEYASLTVPIVEFIEDLLQQTDDQLVVLIPTVIPPRIRYRILHNQIDLVLSSALRRHPDVVVARVAMSITGDPAVDFPGALVQPPSAGQSAPAGGRGPGDDPA